MMMGFIGDAVNVRGIVLIEIFRELERKLNP